jgi:hypothetical protein
MTDSRRVEITTKRIPFSSSRAKRKLMDHFVVNLFLLVFQHWRLGSLRLQVQVLIELGVNAPDTFHLTLGGKTFVEAFSAKVSDQISPRFD